MVGALANDRLLPPPNGEPALSAELSIKDWLLSRRRDPRLERITGNLIVLVAALLACWTIWLGSSLPPDPLTQHWSLTADIGLDDYSLTWVGLDCIEVIGLAACGLLFRRASPSARTVALLTIPVFCLDAWFDVMTSVSKADLVTAVIMAILGELPAAFILSWVAWKALSFHQGSVTDDSAGRPLLPPASSTNSEKSLSAVTTAVDPSVIAEKHHK
jgi:hypothetical protein